MKPVTTLHGADRSSSTWHCSSALLIIAIAGLLNACGGGAGEPSAAAAPPVVPGTCITGSAPAILTWDAVAGATGYRIYYDTAAGTNPQFVDVPGNLTTKTVTGLAIGETYYFVATALNGSIESNFSNFVCKTIS